VLGVNGTVNEFQLKLYRANLTLLSTFFEEGNKRNVHKRNVQFYSETISALNVFA